MARATVGQIRTEPDGRLTPVTEAERREVFLRAIENDHPLMDLILKCINNHTQRRAHTSEIVKRLAEMVLQFPASFPNRLNEALTPNETLDKEKRDLKKENQELKDEIRDLREVIRQIEVENRAVERGLREEMQRKDRKIHELRTEIEQLKVGEKTTTGPGLNQQDFSPRVS